MQGKTRHLIMALWGVMESNFTFINLNHYVCRTQSSTRFSTVYILLGTGFLEAPRASSAQSYDAAGGSGVDNCPLPASPNGSSGVCEIGRTLLSLSASYPGLVLRTALLAPLEAPSSLIDVHINVLCSIREPNGENGR